MVLGVGIAVYGFATVVAAAGLVLLRRWGWRLGVVMVVAGIVGLVGAMVAAGSLDGLLLFGILFWGGTLACIVAEPTRRAVDGPSAPKPGAGATGDRHDRQTARLLTVGEQDPADAGGRSRSG